MFFHHRLWASLYEPREVTAGFVLGYMALVAGGFGVIFVDQGQLPIGVWSARMVSGLFFVVGGAISIPTAWRGWWWVERWGVAILGFAFVSRLIAIVGMGDFTGESHLILAVMAWLFGLCAIAARFAWVLESPYRHGAGPMMPEAQALLSRKRVESAEPDDDA